MSNGLSWPRVSIVTPSYNQAQYLEETIRSVLLQGYPNLEYIVIDGGSTDGSVDIIRKYEPWLAYWVSEPDNGQADGINKGWDRATGEITAWLNSDDCYQPCAVQRVVTEMQRVDASIVYGNCSLVDAEGALLRLITPPAVNIRNLVSHWERMDGIPPQPAIYFRRAVLAEVGVLDTSLTYAMDYDLWLRMSAAGHRFHYLDRDLATYVVHPKSKTSHGWRAFHEEWYRINVPYRRGFGPTQRLRWAWTEWKHFRVTIPVMANQRELFELGWNDPGRGWLLRHLAVALGLSPRLILDPGVQSLLVKSLLGPRAHGWLKSLVVAWGTRV